jgi:hypothetical protein
MSSSLIAQFWAWVAFGVVQGCSMLQHNRIVLRTVREMNLPHELAWQTPHH